MCGFIRASSMRPRKIRIWSPIAWKSFHKTFLQLQPRNTMQSIAIATSVLKRTQDHSQNIAMFCSNNLCNYRNVKFMAFQSESSGLCRILYWSITFSFYLYWLIFSVGLFDSTDDSGFFFVLQHQVCRNDDLHSCVLTWWSWDNVQCHHLKLVYKLHKFLYSSS